MASGPNCQICLAVDLRPVIGARPTGNNIMLRLIAVAAAALPSTKRTWSELSLRVAGDDMTFAGIMAATGRPTLIYHDGVGALDGQTQPDERMIVAYEKVIGDHSQEKPMSEAIQRSSDRADDTVMPDATIVMPAYNAGPFIGEAIQSVLDQTLTSIELIVVDDGSTDATLEIAESFAERDDRVRVFSFDRNRGIAEASNYGFSKAAADLVGRLDADDVAVAVRLERQVAYLRKHPEVVVVGSNAIHISETGERLGLSIAGPPDLATFEEYRRTGEITMVLDGTSLMRKSVFDEVGGYNGVFASAAEIDLHTRMAEYGAVISLQEPLSLYRLHSGSNVHAQFFKGRTVHRYIGYRQKELVAGRTPLAYEAFLAEERRAPMMHRAAIWLADNSMAHYRAAGVAIAGHRWFDAGVHLAKAFVANPTFVVGRVWNRRLSPAARRSMNTSES